MGKNGLSGLSSNSRSRYSNSFGIFQEDDDDSTSFDFTSPFAVPSNITPSNQDIINEVKAEIAALTARFAELQHESKTILDRLAELATTNSQNLTSPRQSTLGSTTVVSDLTTTSNIRKKRAFKGRATAGNSAVLFTKAALSPRTSKDPPEDSKTSAKRVLKVGDRVKVTNNHRGKQGTTGKIDRFTPTGDFAWIHPDDESKEFRRHKNNLVLYSDSESS